MSVGDDSSQSEQKSDELVERKWVLEDHVASRHRQAEFQMARHVVAVESFKSDL